MPHPCSRNNEHQSFGIQSFASSMSNGGMKQKQSSLCHAHQCNESCPTEFFRAIKVVALVDITLNVSISVARNHVRHGLFFNVNCSNWNHLLQIKLALSPKLFNFMNVSEKRFSHNCRQILVIISGTNFLNNYKALSVVIISLKVAVPYYFKVQSWTGSRTLTKM